MKTLLSWLLLTGLVAAAEPEFEGSLMEALRHPDQVRALRFKASAWPGEAYIIQCLGASGLAWPKVFERFPNLEVIEVAGNRSAVFSLWSGRCPLSKLRRLSFEGTYLGLWNESYDFGNLRELELRNCDVMLGKPDTPCFLRGEQLEKLDLSFSKLERVDFQADHVRSLNLSYRENLAIPAWTWKLKGLQELNLSGNGLSSLPSQVAGLNQLRSLQLGDNDLEKLDVAPFPQLRELDLTGNPLSQAPDVSELPLQSLNLSVCQLKQLPRLPNGLRKLNAARNQIAEMPALPASLEEVDLGWNQIGNCASLACLTRMRVLDLSHNQLSKCPPLRALQSLNLGFNQLQEWPVVASVEKLNLAHNLLTEPGPTPPGVQELDLARNSIREMPRTTASIINMSLNPLAVSRSSSAVEGLEVEPNALPDPFTAEEYQILNALARTGRLQRRTINAYSPMGLGADKRARFWKAAEFLRLEPDLMRSYALNNALQFPIDPEQAKRPLLNSVTSEPDLLWHLADQQNIVGFSRVGFSADRSQALVYAQALDSLTQGSGMLVRLARRGDGWAVVSSEALWMRLP